MLGRLFSSLLALGELQVISRSTDVGTMLSLAIFLIFTNIKQGAILASRL